MDSSYCDVSGITLNSRVSMLMHSLFFRVVCTCALFASLAAPLAAQTIDDGIMLRTSSSPATSTHDSWDEYWEGALKRDNGNIGTITTQTNTGTPTTASSIG